MSRGKKVALGVLIALVLVVVALAVVIPLLLDVDRYRPEVVAQLEKATGKPVQIGRLTLTIIPQVSIGVEDFALGNPPGFPKGEVVKARKLSAVADPFALLHREISVTSIELDNPNISLLSDAKGKWNFENPPAKNSPPPPEPAAPPGKSKPAYTIGVISKVTIKSGQVVVAALGASGTPGPSLMEVHGASIQLKNVDLSSFTAQAVMHSFPSPEQFGPDMGFASSIAYAATAPEGLVAEGKLTADILKFADYQVTRLKSKLRIYPKQVHIDDLDMKCYSGDCAGNLALDFGGAELRYSGSARLKGVDVAQFLEVIPSARGKMTGTLDGNAKVNGELVHSPDPLAGIRGSGHASISKGELPSLQLNRNLRTLARLANLGPANGDPSSFASLSSDFSIADGKLASNKINLTGNGIDVDASGSMTMVGEGSLDYQGTAKVSAGSNPLTSVLAGFSGATLADGKLSFPFTLGGNLSAPKFSLKGGGPAGQPGSPAQVVQSGQQAADVVRGIAGLLKKKKKTP